MKIKIGNKWVGDGEPCLIALEPGSTFTNIDEAKKLTKAAANSGADAVKFQTLREGDTERYMAVNNITVDFTSPTGKKKENMFNAIKKKELSDQEWSELVDYSRELNLLFITTASFFETVDLLVNLKVDAIKLSKGDINNVLLTERIAQTNLPVILDGREKFEDMDRAIKICEDNDNRQLVIMHCPSGYPSESSGVHLSAISAIKEKYAYPIGFADHSYGDIMNYPALALGVKMLEKTITLDKTTEHMEHFMSLEPHELKPFIQNVRSIEAAMGNPDILKSSRVSPDVRRCLVSKTDLKKGDAITRFNLSYQRPETLGISCSEGFAILGKILKHDIPKYTPLQWDMFE